MSEQRKSADNIVHVPYAGEPEKSRLQRIANIANQERQKAGAGPWWQNVWEIAGGGEK